MMTVVVGNPKPMSRTRSAAVLVAERLCGSAPATIIDVVDFGPALLDRADPAVSEAVSIVCGSESCVIASPTFKATYTGLLKLFLDQFPAGGLEGVTAFPLMLGAAPQHALAPELLLKPVLVELGATCPMPGLYLLDSAYQEAPVLAPWVEKARRHLAGAVRP
jgi:FMN reductase